MPTAFLLPVGDGHAVHVETFGDPAAGAVLVLDRSWFNPMRYDIGVPPFDEAPEFAYNLIPDALMVGGNLLRVELFSDERNHLLSLCGMVNTHSAAGRMVLMNLANYNQFEREMISERTRDALQHMRAQGVRLGPAPYGYEFSHEVDDKGRRILVPLAHEQEVLSKIKSMRADPEQAPRSAHPAAL